MLSGSALFHTLHTLPKLPGYAESCSKACIHEAGGETEDGTDAIEQVRRMGDDPPNRKERRKGRREAALTDLEGDSDKLISVSKP